ncbi:hypothetical protein MMC08_003078 [Hypocenomyce scalaris]|nr:hypothetical protein [Hypocenomyce scalaris]
MPSEPSDDDPASPTSMATSHIIKSVPRSQFPVRVSDKGPQPFDLRVQKRVMRWRCRPFSLDTDPVWIVEPDLKLIKEVAQTHLELCGLSGDAITIEFFAEGAYHKLYTINTTSTHTGLPKQCIFRVAIPEHPWYKIESEVATTEFVRHTTSIPVPIIYAYDSSTDNKLGLEWMLVEKISGIPIEDTWSDMSYDAQVSLTKQLAQWFHQLSLHTFDEMGSIYMQFTKSEMTFYVGAMIDYNLFQGGRLAYNIHRGPFDCMEDYYDSILDAQQQEFNDIVYHASSRPCGVEANDEPDDVVVGEDKWRDKLEDDPDHKYFGRYGERIGFSEFDLEHIPKAIKALRDNLPVLVIEPYPDSFFTMLSHPDLSFSNILMDASGNIKALIDWEGIVLQPPQFLTQYPLCLKSKETKHVDGMSEELLRINLNAITLTKLRKVFRAELEVLESPYLQVFEEESEYEQELHERVWNRTLHRTRVPNWVEVQLEESDDERDKDGKRSSLPDVAKDEVEDIEKDDVGDNNRLAEEMARVEEEMSRTKTEKVTLHTMGEAYKMR